MKLIETKHSNQKENNLEEFTIALTKSGFSFELESSITEFAESTAPITLKRFLDIRRDKIFAVKSFFSLVRKEPDQITVKDINEWKQWMYEEGNQKNKEALAESTVYTRISHLSAYFEWLRKLPEFAHFIKINPVRLAMPKPPKKYNSPKSKSLTDEDLSKLWNYLEDLAKDESKKAAIRDYAIFRIFMAIGMRREEVIDLGAADIKFTEEGLLIHAQFKGGDYEWRTISDEETIEAVKRYLQITKRESSIGKKHKALWIRFDRGAKFTEIKNKQEQEKVNQAKGKLNQPILESRLSSDSFNKNIKKYAQFAGIGHFHIHQFRHTFARIVAEDYSILETQDALGHANIETTREYVKKIRFKKDKYSKNISERRKK